MKFMFQKFRSSRVVHTEEKLSNEKRDQRDRRGYFTEKQKMHKNVTTKFYKKFKFKNRSRSRLKK